MRRERAAWSSQGVSEDCPANQESAGDASWKGGQQTYTAWDDIVREVSWAVREEMRERAVERILAIAEEQRAEDGDVVDEKEQVASTAKTDGDGGRGMLGSGPLQARSIADRGQRTSGPGLRPARAQIATRPR
jgi:hypothetical protein